MTKTEAKPAIAAVNRLFAKSPDGLREIVRAVMQEILEAEMTDALGAETGERTEARLGYRAGYYPRTLVTRVGKLELRVPRDRDGRFSTELFERYQRSEKALVSALAEMYVQGVSTRKVKAITEELCGHAFSASAITAINKRLDESLAEFAHRPLDEPYPYLILDARYERVREGGVISARPCSSPSASTPRAPPGPRRGTGQPGEPDAGGTSCSACASAASTASSSWSPTTTPAFAQPSARSCPRPPGSAAMSTSCATPSTTCRARPTTTACRNCAGSTTAAIGRRSRTSPPGSLGAPYPKLCDWVEENIAETLTFYRLPREHHKHLKSTNMLERLNEEIKRRTRVVRIFPNPESCLRLVRALAVETHEGWLEEHRYLNMNDLREHKKAHLRQAA